MAGKPGIAGLTCGLILGVLNQPSAIRAAETFSQERASAHLRRLAGDIGPRPLGSPAEKAALEYFAAQLGALGAQVEWQPVSGRPAPRGRDALNTASFNVIGRFPGSGRREIVVGAHIDSASPEIAGADDDASGVAAILEAARVVCASPHAATLVFVAFCGEEAGLVGSKAFVESYPLENVELMLQLDMTSDHAPLMLWIDGAGRQSPAWLVRASLDLFESLGYRGLDYPTIFQSLNGALGGAGSDHEPFLARGIPAIAFVSDIRHPIHTPHDTLEYFRPEGLARSGLLLIALLRAFDRGQPEGRTGSYMLVLAAGRPFFIGLSWLAGFALLSLVAALAAAIRLHQSRPVGFSLEEDRGVKKSWPKLVILHFLMVSSSFGSFWLVGRVKGVRLPWVIKPGAHVLYALLFFVLGIWIALRLAHGWRLRRDAFFFAIRAFGYLAGLTGLFGIVGGPRLALYPAAGLLLLGSACLARPTWLKGALWLLSPLLMFRLLVLPEYYEFLYRAAGLQALAAVRTPLAFLALNLAAILFTLFWSNPFLLGFAAVYRSSGRDLFALKKFRRPWSLVPLGALLIAGGAWLAAGPGYARPWLQEVAVVEKDEGAGRAAVIELASGDYLRGVRLEFGGRREEIAARTCGKVFPLPLDLNWLKVGSRSEVVDGQERRLVKLGLDLDFAVPPYEVSLRLRSDRPFRLEAANVGFRRKKRQVLATWRYYPAMSLRPEFEIRLPGEATLEGEIRAVFAAQALPVVCSGENLHFVRRTEVRRRVTLLKP